MNQINPSNLNLLIGNTDWYTEPLPLDTRYLITEFNLIHIDKEPRELENYILPIPLLYMDELRGPIVSKYSIEIEGSSRGSSLNVAEWSQGEHPQYDWNDLHQVMYLLVT